MPKRPELNLYARAIQYLAKREYSRAELRARLLTQVESGSNVDEVLDELENRGWLSDSRVVEQTLRIRRSRLGMQRIAFELRQKGIDEKLVCEAMPELKDSELEVARGVWQKKFGVFPENDREKARQIRFLQSRGFAQDVISKVLRGI